MHLIGKSIAADRTVTAHVHMEQEADAILIPGMFVQAEIIVDKASSLSIKEAALIEKGGKNFILQKVMEENDTLKFVKVEVSKGNATDGGIVIMSDKTLKVGKIYLLGANSLF